MTKNTARVEISKKHARLLLNIFNNSIIDCQSNTDIHITRQGSRVVINIKKHKAYIKINISTSVSYTAGILVNNVDYEKISSLYYHYDENTNFEDLAEHMNSDFSKLLNYYNMNDSQLLTPIYYLEKS